MSCSASLRARRTAGVSSEAGCRGGRAVGRRTIRSQSMSCRTRYGIHTCVRKVAPCPTWMPDRVRHDEEWSMKAEKGRDSKTRYNGDMQDDLPHAMVVDDDRRLRHL